MKRFNPLRRILPIMITIGLLSSNVLFGSGVAVPEVGAADSEIVANYEWFMEYLTVSGDETYGYSIELSPFMFTMETPEQFLGFWDIAFKGVDFKLNVLDLEGEKVVDENGDPVLAEFLDYTYNFSGCTINLRNALDFDGHELNVTDALDAQSGSTGTFDGRFLGNTISNLNIVTTGETSNVGLFPKTFENSVIDGVEMVDCTVKLNNLASHVGMLVGWNWGTIINCNTSGEIVFNSDDNYETYIGGLAGKSQRDSGAPNYIQGSLTISNCFNTAKITAKNEKALLGGIVGYNNSYNIVSTCFNTGAITGGLSAGGITGYLGDGSITSCYNTGEVTTEVTGGYAGGIAGKSYVPSISKCYNAAKVVGSDIGKEAPISFLTNTDCIYVTDFFTLSQLASFSGSDGTPLTAEELFQPFAYRTSDNFQGMDSLLYEQTSADWWTSSVLSVLNDPLEKHFANSRSANQSVSDNGTYILPELDYFGAAGSNRAKIISKISTIVNPSGKAFELDDGFEGHPYEYKLQTYGFDSIFPYIVEDSTIEGNIPSGIRLKYVESDGLYLIVKSEDSVVGEFEFEVVYSFDEHTTFSVPYTLNIIENEFDIITPVLYDGIKGEQYSIQLESAQSGVEYELVEGVLPSGLTLSKGGEISGKPTESGTFPIKISAQIGESRGIKFYSLVILKNEAEAVEPEIISIALPNGVLGNVYETTLIATGTGPFTFTEVDEDGDAVTETQLPPGLSLNENTGVISGTPTNYLTYNFTVKVEDSNGKTTTKDFQIIIKPKGAKPQIGLPGKTGDTVALPSGAKGKFYSYQIPVTGYGVTVFELDKEEGSLPPNVVIDSNGLITGIPNSVDDYTFTVKLSYKTQNLDEDNPKLVLTETDSRIFTIKIKDSPSAPEFETATLPTAYSPREYIHTLQASGSAPMEFSLIDGALPEGMTLSKNGTLYGIPILPVADIDAGETEITQKDYTFTVQVSNGYESDLVEKEFTLTVKKWVPENDYQHKSNENDFDKDKDFEAHINADLDKLLLVKLNDEVLNAATDGNGGVKFKEGSSIVTIMSKTFENVDADTTELNLTVEFDDGIYTRDLLAPPGPGDSGGNGGGGNDNNNDDDDDDDDDDSSSSRTSRDTDTTTAPRTTTTPPTTTPPATSSEPEVTLAPETTIPTMSNENITDNDSNDDSNNGAGTNDTSGNNSNDNNSNGTSPSTSDTPRVTRATTRQNVSTSAPSTPTEIADAGYNNSNGTGENAGGGDNNNLTDNGDNDSSKNDSKPPMPIAATVAVVAGGTAAAGGGSFLFIKKLFPKIKLK